MTHAPRRARRGRPGGVPSTFEGLLAGAVALDPLLRSACPVEHRDSRCCRRRQPPTALRLRRPDTAMRPWTSSTGRTPRGWVASSATRATEPPSAPVRTRSGGRQRPGPAPTDGGRRCSCRPLRSRTMGTEVAAEQRRHPVPRAGPSTPRSTPIVPRARGHQLLQGAVPALHHAPPPPPRCRGQQAGEPGRQRPHVDGGRLGPALVEGHVEVLGQRLAPGGQGQPEAELGPGGEPLRSRPAAARPGAGPAPTSGPRPAGW